MPLHKGGAGIVVVEAVSSKDLKTGVVELDEQHEALFRCVKGIEQAAQNHTQLLTIHAISQLRLYVREHFSAEERLMRLCGYPRLEEHIAQHRRFTMRLYDLMMANTRQDNAVEMVAFLTEWLSDHVAHTDMDYVPYLKNLQSAGHV